MITGGKLASAFLLAAAMALGATVFLMEAGVKNADMPLPIAAVAATGAFIGWKLLARNLTGDFVRSGLHGVGAGAVALLCFAALHGLRSAAIVHFAINFGTVFDAMEHVLKVGFDAVAAVFRSSATLVTLLVGCFLSGSMAGYFNRIWR